MTYLQFHLVFTAPLVALLSVWSYGEIRAGRPLVGWPGVGNRFAWLVLALHAALALIYTSPWDNVLVSREVWGYPAGRVLFVIGFVPFEEYLFFVLQTLITGLWLFGLTRLALGRYRPKRRLGAGAAVLVRWSGVIVLLALAGTGLVLLGDPSGTYLGLILVWATPVLALQWGFGGDLIVGRWQVVVVAVAVPTVYLWLADRVAIELGIWWISEVSTTGLELIGLPLEEAVFFLVTNLLVGFGLTLALHPGARGRLRAVWPARAGR